MKKLITVFLIITSSFIFAYENKAVETPGKIFFKDQDNMIQKKSVTLFVPPMGQGDLWLSCDEHGDLNAERFFSKKKSGRVVFYIIFPNPHDLENAESKLVFKGTYTRGTNAALYYGDFFQVDGLEEKLDKDQIDQTLEHEATYKGGFGFRKEIEQ